MGSHRALTIFASLWISTLLHFSLSRTIQFNFKSTGYFLSTLINLIFTSSNFIDVEEWNCPDTERTTFWGVIVFGDGGSIKRFIWRRIRIRATSFDRISSLESHFFYHPPKKRKVKNTTTTKKEFENFWVVLFPFVV